MVHLVGLRELEWAGGEAAEAEPEADATADAAALDLGDPNEKTMRWCDGAGGRPKAADREAGVRGEAAGEGEVEGEAEGGDESRCIAVSPASEEKSGGGRGARTRRRSLSPGEARAARRLALA